MSRSSVAPRRREPRRKPTTERVALPRLPRTLHALEVANGRRYVDWPRGERWPLSREAEPFMRTDLTTDVLGRLLARAEVRARRLQARSRRDGSDRYWLEAELKLLIPRAHAKTVRRWRERIGWRVHHASKDLELWRRLEDFLLAHEPEPDAWLRRQLGTLGEGTPRC
jgi:hypothetical protein